MKKIEMYTSDTCPNCTKLKEYLNQNNIEYIEYNISKSSEHKRNLIKEGFLSVLRNHDGTMGWTGLHFVYRW